MEKIFGIPTLNNERDAFLFMAELQTNVLNCAEKVIVLNFEKCSFSHAVFTSFIGAITEICQVYHKKVRYRFVENSPVLEYFKRSGMYDYMVSDGGRKHINQNALPFWKVRMDEDDLMTYIDNIIGLSRIRITNNARQQLFKSLYELFVNARDHSSEKYGVYSCGHWMPNKKHLVFSLYDTGVGIPRLVKSKVDTKMTDEEALKWALIGGHSTRQLEKGVPRGLGLSDLKKFVKINNGRLTILSNGVFYDYSNSKARIEKFSYENIGTMVCVVIDQDDSHIYVE